MRYVTLRIDVAGVGVDSLPGATVPETVDLGPIRSVELLADGSIVFLRSVGGEIAAYRAAIESSDSVYSYSLSGGESAHAFAHVEPTDAGRRLLEWKRQFPLVIRPPIEFDGDSVVVTLVGEVSVFTDATESLPEDVSYTVIETGEYWPDDATAIHGLTDRQREILATAIELGYYENPRQATQADLARALSVSPGTVGDHLRKIEAQVFRKFSGVLSGAQKIS